MYLLGLNGRFSFLVEERLDIYFADGYFPYQPTWFYKDLEPLMDSIPDDDYVAVGFSAGGTLCHYLPMIDERCQGTIIHSGQFFPQRIEGLVDDFDYMPDRQYPILLLSTEHDWTRCGIHIDKAFDYYANELGKRDVTHIEFPKRSWIGHEFKNGLPAIVEWCSRKFNFEVVLK